MVIGQSVDDIYVNIILKGKYGSGYMFKLNLKNEDVLLKITAMKPVNKKNVLCNFVGNLLTGAGGDIADKVNLILSKVLYTQNIKGILLLGLQKKQEKLKK